LGEGGVVAALEREEEISWAAGFGNCGAEEIVVAAWDVRCACDEREVGVPLYARS